MKVSDLKLGSEFITTRDILIGLNKKLVPAGTPIKILYKKGREYLINYNNSNDDTSLMYIDSLRKLIN
jgi:hypothetical protein